MAREWRTAAQPYTEVAGFSLLELLAVTSIMALTLSLGGGLADLLQRERNFRDVLELRRLINYARSEAVFREIPMTLCAIDADKRCEQHWSGRTIAIFEDANRDFRLDPAEAIRLEHWPDERGQLVWKAALRRQYLVFNPGGDTAQNGSFVLCRDGEHSPANVVISINRGGRSYVREKAGNSRHSC